MVWIVLLVVALAAILSGVAISYVAGAAAVMAFVLTDHTAYLGILPQTDLQPNRRVHLPRHAALHTRR